MWSGPSASTGSDRAYIITGYDNENEYLYAKNIYNYKYRKHQAFIFSNETIIGYTGNRQEVLA